jgi:Ca-activated chloride channel family protein
VGYLLDEIRLHGENGETKDEVTKLARKYGIVTPYTAYLIVEDEKKRDIPESVRSFQSLDKDAAAIKQGEVLYDGFKRETVGDSAVANSQYGMNFKGAEVATAAIADNISLGTRQAGGGTLSYSLQFNNSASLTTNVMPAAGPAQGNILAQVNQSAQQTRFINGKNFFQNGSQWTDTEVQNAAKAQHIRIQFNSKEYFALARTNKQALPWLAQGNNVQFVLGGQIYEIYP